MNEGSANARMRPRSAHEWAGIIEEWRQSGLDPREFCTGRGVTMGTFVWWRSALRTMRLGHHPRRRRSCSEAEKAGSGSTTQTLQMADPGVPGFVEIVSQKATYSPPARRVSGVEVVLAGGRSERRVRIDTEFDAATFQRVVSLLEEV